MFLLVALLYHVFQMKKKDRFSVILLVCTSCLWLVTTGLWAVMTHSLNNMNRGTAIYSSKRYPANDSTRYLRLKIALSSGRYIGPGQHINLISRHHRGWLQSHPYCVAWENEKGGQRFLYFLIECQKGFSRSMQLYKTIKDVSPDYVYLDGPYGPTPNLKSFDTVLFCSKGIGVASQLSLMQDLVKTHNNATARIRRMSLLWFIESPSTFCAQLRRNDC
jgi:predicted ferric reductase